MKNPCTGCKNVNLCKYAEDMQKAVEEISAALIKYDAATSILWLQSYCKQNQPPIDIPNFLQGGLRSAT